MNASEFAPPFPFPSRGFSRVEMEYGERLVAAAEFVLSGERGHMLLDPNDFGVKAALKPHQVEGVSWLVRRYETGVNVVLGRFFFVATLILCLSRS